MSKEVKLSLPPLKIGVLTLKVEGTSPYMPEPMDSAVTEMYNKKKSKQTYKKDDLSEEDKVQQKYYYTSDGQKGIPARAFYRSMERASSYLFDKKDGGMRNVREGVTILGDVLPLEYENEHVIEHWGRMSGMTKAPRKILRNAFERWSVILQIQYNESQLSPEQIINVLNYAGFYVGVGAFRKERSGNYGCFKIVN